MQFQVIQLLQVNKMIKLHFLEANKPLTKTFSVDNEGALVKTSYPMVKRFTSHEEHINSIQEFHDKLKKHAALGNCLLKGMLNRPLNNESRANRTHPDTPTKWVVLDVDGLPFTPDEFLKLIGCEDVDHIVQYSASSGIILSGQAASSAKYDRYHIFLLLTNPEYPAKLKRWLKNLNLSTPAFKKHLALTASGMALKWPIDISVCQNDKLIFIAPPQCEQGVTDTLISQRLNEVAL